MDSKRFGGREIMECDICDKPIGDSYYMIKEGEVICVCHTCRVKMKAEGYKGL